MCAAASTLRRCRSPTIATSNDKSHLLPVRHLQDISVRIGDIGPVTYRRPPIFGTFQQYAGVARAVRQLVDLGTAAPRTPQKIGRATSDLMSLMSISYAVF